ncbi:TatD family hydrolase [Luteococcus sp. Sow4_B9]|uniref:TatD family hydrolase n=1 Tax=Luteococcus sp. Sow4_B9 TaxID=3438792 RepID=UPI003F9E354F
MPVLLDTHHHFDFLDGVQLRRDFLAALAGHDVRIVAQTLTPSAFKELMAVVPELEAAGASPPLCSLGLHPWQLSSEQFADEQLDLFAREIHRTRFVGEIGLDFSPRRATDCPPAQQRRVLRQILGLVLQAAREGSGDEPYVLSLHAVRSTSDVLDLLTELDAARAAIVPVVHRFSGTSDELTRLVELGGYLSVHPHMLQAKRGRAYVRQVPADRLLLETDLPVEPSHRPPLDGDESAAARAAQATGMSAAREVADALASTIETLSQLRRGDMRAVVLQTQARLYGIR